MGKKKKILAGICIIVLIALNVLIVGHEEAVNGNYELHLTVKSDTEQNVQVYYSTAGEVSEEMSQVKPYDQIGNNQEFVFSVPFQCNMVRLDLGNKPGYFEIQDVYLSFKDTKESIAEIENPKLIEGQQLESLEVTGETLKIWTNGDDPYLWLPLGKTQLYPVLEKSCSQKTTVKNMIMLLLIDGGAAVVFVFRKKVMTLPIELLQNRKLILSLAKNDFKTKYAGSYLGIVWAFVQPVVTILVYWFVFSVGLKAGNVSDYPFVLYLVSGIVPWFFFQDALNGGTNALIEYNYLVKKVVFKISVLPIVKMISAFFVHAFFVGFALILCALYGYMPSLETLQIIYYSFCTFMITLGVVYATSAVVVFFRDLTQIINIVLQVGIWLTPIMWDVNMLENYPWLIKLFKFNPMYYIVTGYRDSMLGHEWFWKHWGWTAYFWIVTAILFALGSWMFKRLKPHFADVL